MWSMVGISSGGCCGVGRAEKEVLSSNYCANSCQAVSKSFVFIGGMLGLWCEAYLMHLVDARQVGKDSSRNFFNSSSIGFELAVKCFHNLVKGGSDKFLRR